jgi:hypothetical protein
MTRKPSWSTIRLRWTQRRRSPGPAHLWRQELVRSRRRRTSALPRRLRNSGRPGAHHSALHRTAQLDRSRSLHRSSAVQGAGAGSRGRSRPDRCVISRPTVTDNHRRELRDRTRHRSSRHSADRNVGHRVQTSRVIGQPTRGQRANRTIRQTVEFRTLDNGHFNQFGLASRLCQRWRTTPSTVGSRTQMSGRIADQINA